MLRPSGITGGMRVLDGLSALLPDFGWFVIDQWGCLHDGHRLHPGALPVLEGLAAAGRPVALVSNSSLGEGPSRRLLRDLGLPDRLYTALVTAGSMAEGWLAAERLSRGPLRVLSLLGPPGPEAVVTRLGLHTVTDPAQADVVVAAGLASPDQGPDLAQLRDCVQRGLPLLCLNPDRVSLQPDGSLWLCPGSFAQAYAELGGQVRSWGKPDPAIYEAAYGLLGRPAGRGMAIGDSLDHDVLGAHQAGLASLFISGGVHGPGLRPLPGGLTDPAGLGALFAAHGLWPQHIQPSLRW